MAMNLPTSGRSWRAVGSQPQARLRPWSKFAQSVGARFACSVNSCTSALHLGLEALGVQAGDRVLVPTMTFTASAEVIRYLGADPVFLDVEYGSSLITPEGLAAVDRDAGVRALIVVHFAGQPARMLSEEGPGILEICGRRGVRVLEDAAHAFPTRCGDRMVGGLGDATCFSFYANKTITAGEGGMLTTNNEAIAARVRVMSLHGIDRDVWNRFIATSPPGNTTSWLPATSTTCPTSTQRSDWPNWNGRMRCGTAASSSPLATPSGSSGCGPIDLPAGSGSPSKITPGTSSWWW